MNNVFLLFFADMTPVIEQDDGSLQDSPEDVLIRLEEMLADGRIEPYEIRQILRDNARRER